MKRIAFILLAAAMLAACSGLEPSAKAPGDPDVHALVRDVESRMADPYVLSEGEETAIYNRAERLLHVKGDAGFAKALAAEPSKSVSALRAFFSHDLMLESYPRTAAVLASAPRIQWPAAIAVERRKG